MITFLTGYIQIPTVGSCWRWLSGKSLPRCYQWPVLGGQSSCSFTCLRSELLRSKINDDKIHHPKLNNADCEHAGMLPNVTRPISTNYQVSVSVIYEPTIKSLLSVVCTCHRRDGWTAEHDEAVPTGGSWQLWGDDGRKMMNSPTLRECFHLYRNRMSTMVH